jgi:hypothetical protein
LREGPRALIIFFQNEKIGGKVKQFIRGRGRRDARDGREEVDLLDSREFLSAGSCGKRIKYLVVISGHPPGREIRGRGRARWLKSRNLPLLKRWTG